MSNFEHQDYFDAQLAAYRTRLLNLTLRNRMLNFKHRERGRDYLRIIDTGPDLFLEEIRRGSLDFAHLPPRDEMPEDEKTPDFRHALEQAQLTDEAYLKALDKLDESEGEAAERDELEPELIKRVLVTCQLHSPKPSSRTLPMTLARASGIL